MPKRKRRHNDYDEIRRKIKKLERDLHRVRDTNSANPREDRNRYHDYTDHSDDNPIRYESENSLDGDIYGDVTEYPPPEDFLEVMDLDAPVHTAALTTAATAAPAAAPAGTHIVAPAAAPVTAPATATTGAPTAAHAASHTAAPVGAPAAAPAAPPAAAPVGTPIAAHAAEPAATPSTVEVTNAATDATVEAGQAVPGELDSSILEILGADPSENIEYGKEIRKELATRLEHIATAGLTKEVRKELLDKYLIPANCAKIGAPLMNAEIKAAVTEIITKRDKGIEVRQKEIACAISALAGIINRELESTEKDNERLKQLMDVGRILCDVQHSESVTRRNFAIFSIKKDLKDQVTNAKIDKFLFGEGLAEALRTAKAVSKSGTDLKVKSQVKVANKPFNSTSHHLNWRAPAPARRQQGPQRNREPAHSATPDLSARHSRAPRHGNSSKTSQPQQRYQRRR